MGEVGADVPLLDRDALGDPGRTGGEHDVREVRGARPGRAVTGCGGTETAEQPAVGQLGRRQAQQAGGSGGPVAEDRVQRGLAGDPRVAPGGERRAERDDGRADALDGQVSRVGDDRARGQQAHPAWWCPAPGGGEIGGQVVGEVGEFGVRQLGAAGLQRRTVAVDRDRGREPVVEGVPLGGDAHGLSFPDVGGVPDARELPDVPGPRVGGAGCAAGPGSAGGPGCAENAQLNGVRDRSRRLTQR